MSFSTAIENRYRLLFRFFDLNKDGLHDRKDHNILMENIGKVYKSDATAKLISESNKWWGMFEKLGLEGAVTEEKFTTAMGLLFEKDFEQFRKDAFKAFEVSFSVIDHDKDNKISLDELVKFYACCNVTDTERVKKIFDKLDLDKDGFVTREEWIMARMDFATRDDPDHDFGFMFDFSSPVPENRSSGRLTPNLLRRYKTAFRFFDTNKDGVHTLEDYLLLCDNIGDQYNGGEDERAALRHTVESWWKHLEPMAANGKITEEHYVYLLMTRFVTDFEQMRLEVFQISRRWFKIADHDSDDLVSEDEFCKYFAAMGKTDKDKVKRIFRQVDLDDDGFISEEEWILANLDYWTRDDPTYDYGFLYDVE